MTGPIEQRARALLAEQYELMGMPNSAATVRAGGLSIQFVPIESCVSAIAAALRSVEQPFVNLGDSEQRHIADGRDLNCPACGGSGHVDDVRQPSAPEPVTAMIASACRDPSFVEWALNRHFVLVPRDPTPEMLEAAGTIDGYEGDDADADHINWWHVMVEAAPPAPRSDDAPREAAAEAVREAWRTAIRLGNNICVQESDRENDNDGDCGWINGTGECARRIREYEEPEDSLLVAMLTEAGAHHALVALTPSTPRDRGASEQMDIVLDLIHASNVDGYTDDQASFLRSIAERVERLEVSAPRKSADRIVLTSGQIAQLAEFAGRDDEPLEDQATLVVQHRADGHSGPGMYAHYEELPDEGAMFLDGTWPARRVASREAAQQQARAWRSVFETVDKLDPEWHTRPGATGAASMCSAIVRLANHDPLRPVTDEDIERVAQTLWDSAPSGHKLIAKAGYPIDWPSQADGTKRDYRKLARAALECYRERLAGESAR